MRVHRGGLAQGTGVEAAVTGASAASTPECTGPMSTATLTAQLAERVMGWGVAPDRFLVGNRRWMPRWRFQPMEKLEDAFRLLEQAAPQFYSMGSAADSGAFSVKVCIGGKVGEAQDKSKPRAITLAVARSIGLEV